MDSDDDELMKQTTSGDNINIELMFNEMNEHEKNH